MNIRRWIAIIFTYSNRNLTDLLEKLIEQRKNLILDESFVSLKTDSTFGMKKLNIWADQCTFSGEYEKNYYIMQIKAISSFEYQANRSI
jgi:hypothetical protein